MIYVNRKAENSLVKITTVTISDDKEEVVFLDQERTRRVLVGKTLVENKPMLYVFIQVWHDFKWNIEQMFFARSGKDIINYLRR